MVKQEALPLIKEITLSLSPTQVFEVFKNEPYSFLLESQAGPSKLSRYSFIGFSPFLVFKSQNFEALREQLQKYQGSSFTSPFPFTGGAVGYFSYDFGKMMETLESRIPDDLNLPQVCLGFYDRGIVFDHLLNKVYLFSTGLPEEDESKAQARAEARLKELEIRLTQLNEFRVPCPPCLSLATVPANAFGIGDGRRVAGAASSEFRVSGGRPALKSNFTKQAYLEAVKTARDYIIAGDIYQVNLSQRFEAEFNLPPFELYKKLKALNPAPFAAYLNFDEVKVVSSSPERFLKLSKERIVQTRPIKGTRPRGKNFKEDKKLAQELLLSPKEQAEHIMIVDLERNDLGRVCEYGSVKWAEPMILETFPTVFHLVSTVEGKLNKGKDQMDLLKACFPGGSITGAPKIRAMEIIEELEPTKRNLYTGSIGYLSFSGEMDLNIVIRTFLITQDKVYFQVGGGVVFDSSPEDEYDETLDKAKALIQALEP